MWTGTSRRSQWEGAGEASEYGRADKLVGEHWGRCAPPSFSNPGGVGIKWEPDDVDNGKLRDMDFVALGYNPVEAI